MAEIEELLDVSSSPFLLFFFGVNTELASLFGIEFSLQIYHRAHWFVYFVTNPCRISHSIGNGGNKNVSIPGFFI
jgi:hypothetical protein